MTPDVNVLLAAARPDHPHHRSARNWLSTMEREGSRAFLLFPIVVASFLRLIINPRVFPSPASPAEAIAYVDALLAAPTARIVRTTDEWTAARPMLLATKPLKPNDVPDVWLAAAVRAHGDHLVTFDVGFRRLLTRAEVTILV